MVTNPPAGRLALLFPNRRIRRRLDLRPPAKQKNMLGLIALIVGIVGFIFGCIPGALIVGWVLLPIAFILGIVGLFQSGKANGTSVAAIIVSIVEVVVGVSVFFTLATDAFRDASSKSDLSTSPPASPTATNEAAEANPCR